MNYVIVSLGLLSGILCKALSNKLIKDRVGDSCERFYLTGKISWMLWSVVTALGFVIIKSLSASTIQMAESMIIFLICLSISTIDLAIKKIPNQLLLSLMIIKLTFIILNYNKDAIVPSLIGLFVGYTVFTIPSLLKINVGGGDIKLAAVIGFYLGINGFFQAMLIMSVFVGLFYVFIKIRNTGNLKTSTPLGPHISFGFILTMLFPLL